MELMKFNYSYNKIDRAWNNDGFEFLFFLQNLIIPLYKYLIYLKRNNKTNIVVTLYVNLIFYTKMN